jgi:hypothetical protein
MVALVEVSKVTYMAVFQEIVQTPAGSWMWNLMIRRAIVIYL